MRRFLSRLDRLADRMIDMDTLMPAKGVVRPVPIKAIFDNLRYYTVLSFMYLGLRVLIADGSWLASAAAFVLGLIILVLFLLVALQTSGIFLITLATAFTALLPPRHAVRLRRGMKSKNSWMRVGIVLLLLPVVAAAVTVALGLFSALSKAGLV